MTVGRAGHSISDEEMQPIIDRLSSYKEPETTKVLYEFGLFLVNEGVDRAHRLDSKATVLAGFTGTILALLAATSPFWKPQIRPGDAILFLIALMFLFAAALCSLLAMVVMKFEWFDYAKNWLAAQYLEHPDQLQRYHLLAMYKVTLSHKTVSANKTRLLEFSQWFLVASSVFVFLVLLRAIWQAKYGSALSTLLDGIGRWIL